MNTIVKYTLLAATIGSIFYLFKAGKDQVAEWAKNISITFNGIGRPEFRNGAVTIPVQLSISNPTPITIPVDNITGKIFLLKSGMWQPVGTIPNTGSVQFAPGTGTQIFYPSLDIQKLNPLNSGGSILQLATGLIQSGGQIKAKLKIEITATFKSKNFTNTSEQEINLNDLLRAAA